MRGTHQRLQATARPQPLPLQGRCRNEALGRARSDRRQHPQYRPHYGKAGCTVSACPPTINQATIPRRPRRVARFIGHNPEKTNFARVLGVSPDASVDEVRRRYLQKIKQAHPDRVAWLEPESLAAAESRSKALNAAYAEAMRARRASSELGPPPNEG
jgi:DnaJ domain